MSASFESAHRGMILDLNFLDDREISCVEMSPAAYWTSRIPVQGPACILTQHRPAPVTGPRLE